MSFLFRPCAFEMDYEAYIRFLLQHHDELRLPYPFAIKLSFISSPLIFGKAMLVLAEESYEIIGAAGFVYGTGPNQYEDRHICQVEVAFLRAEYRSTPLFLRALRVLLNEMKAGNPGVKTVQFWVGEGQEEPARLFAKFHAFPGSGRFTASNLTCYQVPFHELEGYCLQFGNRYKQ